MIKVCNNTTRSVKIGSVTIPPKGIMLLTNLPSVATTQSLLNKGTISVFYVSNETSTNTVEPDSSVDNSTTNNAEVVSETTTTTTRKRRTHKETTSLDNNEDETNESNTTKGDMNNASD